MALLDNRIPSTRSLLGKGKTQKHRQSHCRRQERHLGSDGSFRKVVKLENGSPRRNGDRHLDLRSTELLWGNPGELLRFLGPFQLHLLIQA